MLKAAEQEFLEKGFDGATMRGISTRANVDHPLVHYYFKSKQHLFERIIQDKMQVMVRSVISIIADDSMPLGERLTNGISAHVDFIFANPLLPRFLIKEIERLKLLIGKDDYVNIPQLLEKLSRDLPPDISPHQLMIDIIPLDIFPFLFRPMTLNLGLAVTDDREFCEQVKKENITIILKRLGL